jgi:hypothetical protein
LPKKVLWNYGNGKSDWVGRRKEDTSPILYMSGTLMGSFDEREFFKMSGCRHRCFSYAYCGYGSPLASRRYLTSLDICLELGVSVFLDSGAHSFHNMIHRGQTIGGKLSPSGRRAKVLAMVDPFLDGYSKYLRWCSKEGKNFDFYVTLDADKDCPLIYECTKKLEKLGTRPVPVYHGDQSIDWVKRYIDEGHQIIGVGIHRVGKPSRDSVRRYYDTVLTFCDKQKVACHGFAVTGDIMFEFPFYSADSTTWLKAAAYGKILDIRPEKQRTALIHVSRTFSARSPFGQLDNLAKSVRKYLRDQVELRGFDWERIRIDMAYRATYNARILVEAIKTNTAKAHTEHSRWTSVVTV